MVLPAMQSIVRRQRYVSSHRSLTASLALGLLGCMRFLTMRGIAQIKNGGVSPAASCLALMFLDQRNSCSTLACDWLANASAETAIDCRVESAWLLAASSLGSASVRLDEPVCSTLIRFLLKS